MFVLRPHLTTLFPSIHVNYFSTYRHHQPPLFAANPVTFSSAATRPIIVEDGPNDILSLQSRRYDFTPLLRFLSTDSDSNSSSLIPTSLDPTEFQLAESYQAVPAPLWHALLKSLCSSSSSIRLAYAVVSWLQKHNLGLRLLFLPDATRVSRIDLELPIWTLRLVIEGEEVTQRAPCRANLAGPAAGLGGGGGSVGGGATERGVLGRCGGSACHTLNEILNEISKRGKHRD